MASLNENTTTSYGGFVSLKNIGGQNKDMLVAILIRLSKRFEGMFTSICKDYISLHEIYQKINAHLELDHSNLVAYVKGLFIKNTFHTFLKIENDIHYDIFHKILTNADLSNHTDELRTMFFAKLDYTKYDIQCAITWFEKANLTIKKIMVMILYMEISYSTDQIKQNEEKDTGTESETESETETEIETDTENEYELQRQPEQSETESEEEEGEGEGEFQYELVTCGDCGNQWDGYAQCNCWEYNYNQNDTGPNDSTICREEHPEKPQEPVPTSHPTGWSPTAHYGMCGQSCPCCRAEVGDTFGACPICKKN